MYYLNRVGPCWCAGIFTTIAELDGSIEYAPKIATKVDETYCSLQRDLEWYRTKGRTESTNIRITHDHHRRYFRLQVVAFTYAHLDAMLKSGALDSVIKDIGYDRLLRMRDRARRKLYLRAWREPSKYALQLERLTGQHWFLL